MDSEFCSLVPGRVLHESMCMTWGLDPRKSRLVKAIEPEVVLSRRSCVLDFHLLNL